MKSTVNLVTRFKKIESLKLFWYFRSILNNICINILLYFMSSICIYCSYFLHIFSINFRINIIQHIINFKHIPHITFISLAWGSFFYCRGAKYCLPPFRLTKNNSITVNCRKKFSTILEGLLAFSTCLILIIPLCFHRVDMRKALL